MAERVQLAPCPVHGHVHYPSDLLGAGPTCPVAALPNASAHVAGKLVTYGPTTLLLSDASCQMEVELDGSASTVLHPGQWLEVVGVLENRRIVCANIVAVHPGTFAARGEFPRLVERAAALRALDDAKRWVRHELGQRGFVEVTTPVRVAAPGTDPYIDPEPAGDTGDHWLITSPEFHMKRLLAGGMPRIFQFAPCTRREERGTWHQSEFTMLEWYRGVSPMASVMQDTELLVSGVFEQLAATRAELGRARSTTSSKPLLALPSNTEPPFERLTVREAFRRFAGVDDAAQLARDDEARYFELLVAEVEPALSRFDRPVFLFEYPATQAALARRCDHDDSVAERFELYVSGVELCNGYGELTCPREQRARFERDNQLRQERGRPVIPIDEALLAAMTEGLPPCAGNAVGFERLVALALGVELAAVVAFPDG